MKRWHFHLDLIGLAQMIIWGTALLIITSCGHSVSLHPIPSPAPNPPAAVSQR